MANIFGNILGGIGNFASGVGSIPGRIHEAATGPAIRQRDLRLQQIEEAKLRNQMLEQAKMENDLKLQELARTDLAIGSMPQDQQDLYRREKVGVIEPEDRNAKRRAELAEMLKKQGYNITEDVANQTARGSGLFGNVAQPPRQQRLPYQQFGGDLGRQYGLGVGAPPQEQVPQPQQPIVEKTEKPQARKAVKRDDGSIIIYNPYDQTEQPTILPAGALSPLEEAKLFATLGRGVASGGSANVATDIAQRGGIAAPPQPQAEAPTGPAPMLGSGGPMQGASAQAPQPASMFQPKPEKQPVTYGEVEKITLPTGEIVSGQRSSTGRVSTISPTTKPTVSGMSPAQQEASTDNLTAQTQLNDIKDIWEAGGKHTHIGRKLRTGADQAIGNISQSDSDLLAAIAMYRNRLIKLLSGTAVSKSEEARMLEEIPQINDNPTTFMSKWETSKKNLVTAQKYREQMMKTKGVSGDAQLAVPQTDTIYTQEEIEFEKKRRGL